MTPHAMDPNDQRAAAQTTNTSSALSMCPMAGICSGIMRRRAFGWLAMLPGILFIAVGVLIVVEPMILTWFVAGVSVIVGIMLLMMAGFMRRMADGLRG